MAGADMEDSKSADFFSANVDLLENRFESAAAKYQQLLNAGARHAAVRHNLALAVQLAGRPQDAVQLYNGVIAEWPDYPFAYTGLAACLRELAGQTADAGPRRALLEHAADCAGVAAEGGHRQAAVLMSELLFLTGIKDYNSRAIQAHCDSLCLPGKPTQHYAQCHYDAGTGATYYWATPPVPVEWPPGKLPADGPVVLLVVNRGYVELAANCLASMRANAPASYQRLLCACLDASSALQLEQAGHACTLLPGLIEEAPVGVPAIYASDYFNRLVALKLAVVHALLKRGVDVVFCDADVVWLREPAHLLDDLPLAFQEDEQGVVCTGFFKVTATPAHALLFDPANVPPACAGEQPVVNYMLQRTGTPHRLLPRSLFPSGHYKHLFAGGRAFVAHHNWVWGMDKVDSMKQAGHWLLAGAAEAGSLQERVVEDTRRFRPPPHTFAGYAGPWVENRYFDHFQAAATTPGRGRVYLPIFWTDLAQHTPGRLKQVTAYLEGLPRASAKYYTVLQSSSGLGACVPAGMDLLVFAAGRPCPEAGRSVCIPLLKQEEHAPDVVCRTTRVCFAGSWFGASDYKGLRSSLHSLHGARPGWEFYYGPDWRSKIASSEFSLCPRGFGPTSFRLAESIQLGAVPVVIYQDELWLPYTESLDWEQCAIIVHANDAARLPELVGAADWEALHQAGCKARQMFSYSYVCQYIDQYISGDSAGKNST